MNVKEQEKRYAEYLKEEIEKINAALSEEIQQIGEYADENLEISRGADYDAMVDQAITNSRNEIWWLYSGALERQLSQKYIEDVFGEYEFLF